MSPNEAPILFLVGPTAVGKTRLAIALAQSLNGEIINADSRQVYRHMEVGTAKPTVEERRQAAHHLLDLMPPDQSFSLGSFLSLARQASAEIAGRGRLPIVVGGTGQYIWALQEGWDVPEVPPDADFRESCELAAAREGNKVLYRRLQEIDPERAAELDSRNLRRVIRALEIHHATGRPPSSYRKRSDRQPPSLVIGLTLERDILYDRIDRRVDRMMADGLLDEAQRIAAMGYSLGKGALACPGYRELGQYLDGEISLDEAVQRTKFQTHRLARRQYTWFKPDDSRIRWLDAGSPDVEEQSRTMAAGFR
jgi:tRNA dimethylallyltransferase